MDNPKQFCNALDEWADLMSRANGVVDSDRVFEKAWRLVRLAISKSCLLSRTIYCGEKPSRTPCPVHKGIRSGIHGAWPGSKWADGTPAGPGAMEQRWYDEGCRCFQHKCGCTTGWQPDEHCGCIKLEATKES